MRIPKEALLLQYQRVRNELLDAEKELETLKELIEKQDL